MGIDIISFFVHVFGVSACSNRNKHCSAKVLHANQDGGHGDSKVNVESTCFAIDSC